MARARSRTTDRLRGLRRAFVLLSHPPEDGLWEPGDIVAYRCEDCRDRWDLVLPDDDDWHPQSVSGSSTTQVVSQGVDRTLSTDAEDRTMTMIDPTIQSDACTGGRQVRLVAALLLFAHLGRAHRGCRHLLTASFQTT